MSGSRGEANFVWKCKNCKVWNSRNVLDLSSILVAPFSSCRVVSKRSCAQRESSANIKAAPAAYEHSDPPKKQKIIEFDCRGLEFTEFLPEVRFCPLWPARRSAYFATIFLRISLGLHTLEDTDTKSLTRESGWRKELTPVPSLRELSLRRENGLTMTRRREKRLESQTSSGRLCGHNGRILR